MSTHKPNSSPGSPHTELIIEGARQNNLKNISLRIPHNAVTVITGVSGSGKSSLAFDTLFAEGQWRYVESLSSYTRMFLDRVKRPDVDRLAHIRPSIALEQKNPIRTSRSTVGTASEISDYLRLLFSKIGKPTCPDCHKIAVSHHPSSIAQELLDQFQNSRALVLFPKTTPHPDAIDAMKTGLLKQGFIRVMVGDHLINLNTDALPHSLPSEFLVVVDRVTLNPDSRSRLVEALETAFRESEGQARVTVADTHGFAYSSILQCPGCGRTFPQPRPLTFSFNHPLGACPECKGFGNVLRYDEQLIIPDPNKSLAEGAIEPWTKPSNVWWQQQMIKAFKTKKFDATKPYATLSPPEHDLIWKGDAKIEGINDFFEYLEGKRYKLHVRVFLSRYRSPLPCAGCHGSRLRPEALWFKIQNRNIHEVGDFPLDTLQEWLHGLSLNTFERSLSQDLVKILEEKLSFLISVGLSYLNLNREMRTLSGGEAQRIHLANQLGARLVGTQYVLDEPTIGLHPKDTEAMAAILRDLAHRGNTVIVVEHDPFIIQQADFVIEMGPASGEQGGQVICAAPYETFRKDLRSLTAQYLRGDRSIPVPEKRRVGTGKYLKLTGVREHNLKNLSVHLPLGKLICVTGPSGSGKSTLVEDTVYRVVARALNIDSTTPGTFDALTGIQSLRSVCLIDQEPIGKTPRSNPVTYIKAYQEIRTLFAGSPEARRARLTPAHFSFNTGKGRCPRCQGNGYEKLEMYFIADMYVPCADCEGKRFQLKILNIRVKDYEIHEVLEFTVDQALTVFGDTCPTLRRSLQVLQTLGLGYLRLGQPATSLSGGETQRLKIARELANTPSPSGKGNKPKGILYVLDEPTRGLHLEDVKRLLGVLGQLVDEGHTVLMVEHHLDVIKCADWVIDLGPGGGESGGHIVAQGTPEEIANHPNSITGKYLKPFVFNT
ncbi:MAG: excinuclease ABC subunit UvrA [Nitrospirales bacterium]|nr:excinuclease ABC subunit UvrA [Nitrospirales bacterium]